MAQSRANILKVDIANPPWTPLFQLKVLVMFNEPTRMIPSFLFNQYDLRYVDLSRNGMTRSDPTLLLMNNSRLEFITVVHNFLTGSFLIHSYSRFNLSWLDISLNNIYGELPVFIGYVFPHMIYLNSFGNAS